MIAATKNHILILCPPKPKARAELTMMKNRMEDKRKKCGELHREADQMAAVKELTGSDCKEYVAT